MNNYKDFKNMLKALEGDILLIGKIDDKVFNLLDNNSKITDTYYLNCDVQHFKKQDYDNLSEDVASNINLKEMHKYFKDGIDNIYCNFDEIKKHIPSFIRESLRITKKNIYIVFNEKNDYQKIEKKYKRYGLKVEFNSFDNYNIAIIEANDIIIHFPKETFYYIKDSLEKIYNDISDSI